MNYTYITGDGKRFSAYSQALAHANKIYRRTGAIISVEKLP